jgi:hypothetical protein
MSSKRNTGRKSTQRNMASVLTMIDRDHPAESRLLAVPIRPHGGGEAIFTDRQQAQYKQLVEWVYQVSGSSRPADPPTLDERTSPLPQQGLPPAGVTTGLPSSENQVSRATAGLPSSANAPPLNDTGGLQGTGLERLPPAFLPGDVGELPTEDTIGVPMTVMNGFEPPTFPSRAPRRLPPGAQEANILPGAAAGMPSSANQVSGATAGLPSSAMNCATGEAEALPRSAASQLPGVVPAESAASIADTVPGSATAGQSSTPALPERKTSGRFVPKDAFDPEIFNRRYARP